MSLTSSENSRQFVVSYIYWLALVALLGLFVWLYVYGVAFSWVALLAVGVLSVVCLTSRSFTISFGRVTMDVTDVSVFIALVWLGPVWALVVAGPALIYRDPLRTTFMTAIQVLVLLLGGYVYGLFSGPLLFTAGFDGYVVYGILAAGLTYYLLDDLLNSLLLRLKYGTRLLETIRSSMVPALPSDIATVLTALTSSYLLVNFGPAAALVLFVGALGALVSLQLIWSRQRENDRLKEENHRLRESLNTSTADFALGLVTMLGEREGGVPGRSAATAVYAADIARESGLDEDRVAKVRLAALLQDVGLASLPDEVLQTPLERLNPLGKQLYQEHVERGERLLAGIPEFKEAASWVRWHHERPDGTGYPDRLRSDWIPLESRILAAAGFYASSILDGAHEAANNPALRARRGLSAETDTSLDKDVVRTLLALLDASGEEYALASSKRFALPDSAEAPGTETRPSRLRLA